MAFDAGTAQDSAEKGQEAVAHAGGEGLGRLLETQRAPCGLVGKERGGSVRSCYVGEDRARTA